jgi:hypothetical protein
MGNAAERPSSLASQAIQEKHEIVSLDHLCYVELELNRLYCLA